MIDGNFQAADQLMRTTGASPLLTSFGVFELKNAVRAAVVRRSVTAAEAVRVLALIQRDTVSGLLTAASCDWEKVYREAESLSAGYTLTGGYRALDVLHVAAATVLGCAEFLTFDHRQAELARRAGLTVHP